MRVSISHTADHIAGKLKADTDRETVRDVVDVFTHGGLQAFTLDLITDCVMRRLKNKAED